jgi:TolA-binding protein
MCRRLILLAILLCVPTTLFAGSDADLIARSVEGERLLMSRDYAEAQALFQKLSQDYPESPAGAFGLMAMWQTRMFENRDFRFISQYDAAETKMTALCDERLLPEQPKEWDMFVCASGFGMRGFFDARRDKWMQGLGGAIRSVRTYKRLLWLNPNFIDADMGVGMYEFWRSVVTLRMKWLPFFSDQRAAGMAKLERVVSGGKYVRDLAKANLAYMHIEMKNYDQALGILNDLIVRYPRNVLMRQAKGEVFWWQKKYQDCYETFAQILEDDPKLTRSLYWMAASLVIPYMKVDVAGTPRADSKIPDDIATRAKDQLNQYLQSKPIKIWASASHYWLASIAEWQGDKATAITEYNEALKLDKGGAKEIKKRLERLQ